MLRVPPATDVAVRRGPNCLLQLWFSVGAKLNVALTRRRRSSSCYGQLPNKEFGEEVVVAHQLQR